MPRTKGIEAFLPFRGVYDTCETEILCSICRSRRTCYNRDLLVRAPDWIVRGGPDNLREWGLIPNYLLISGFPHDLSPVFGRSSPNATTESVTTERSAGFLSGCDMVRAGGKNHLCAWYHTPPYASANSSQNNYV